MTKKDKEKLSDRQNQRKPLRLWPAVILAILLWLTRFGVPMIWPETVIIFVMGSFIGVVLIIIWWLFLSRAPRIDRWGAVGLMIVTIAITWFLLHESMRLMPFVAYIIPIMSLIFVAWAVVGRYLSDRLRRITMVVTILLSCSVWTLFQTGGVTGGEFQSDFSWRWSETPEQRLLAQADNQLTDFTPTLRLTDSEPEWPGFRGPERDGIIRKVKIETNWSASPPIELWRRPVGPGWSSFSVHGDLFYTQEQRGEHEVVSCYQVSSGLLIWKHSDTARFWESNGGAGPRGTPTLSNGRVYTLGGTGIVNVLNAIDGSLVWSRNAASDTETKVPMWGFSGSPLVMDDIVIVSVAGSLIAFDLATGGPRWSNPAGGDCYSSPHLVQIDSITQILLQNEAGIISVKPADGILLWEHTWPGAPIVQPTLTANGDILISVDERNGVRRISVTHEANGWNVEERWTSNRIKPYFNDSVVHNGHVFGFDGPRLSCIDLNDGARKWKGGRYGRGQFVLLADQNMLLVLSEKGDLALVKAVPEQFTELARVPAITGKTWNHPVLVGDILLVRNAQEMAAFRLSLSE